MDLKIRMSAWCYLLSLGCFAFAKKQRNTLCNSGDLGFENKKPRENTGLQPLSKRG
jgi:hypothetical protein